MLCDYCNNKFDDDISQYLSSEDARFYIASHLEKGCRL